MIFDLIEHIRRHGFMRLLLAVSGGLDSICLAHYFIENRKALGIEWLGIAHVHHGLREGTADRDAAFVEESAKSHNVPFFLKRLDGEALKAAEGSLEENARDARYKALVEIALDPSTPLHSAQDDTLHTAHPTPHTPYLKGSEATDPIPHTTIAIVTAHHANDQAETMLMRLKRGTTLAGLRGIQEVRVLDDASHTPKQPKVATPYLKGSEATDPTLHTPYLVFLYRPFLNVTRTELLDYARKNKLTWCEDESNADVKFARNKIRHEFLPQLERECPGTTKQLCHIAELADKAYAKMMEKCENEFASCLLNKKSLDPIASTRLQDDRREMPAHSSTLLRSAQDDNAHSTYPKGSEATDPIPHSSLALDKKKLNKILREHANADLSELFRLWLSELGFRFPIGFFYGPKEPAHVKIPVRTVYRKRSIVKIRHTIKFCEFCTPDGAQKFVSCEMNEKDYNEST